MAIVDLSSYVPGTRLNLLSGCMYVMPRLIMSWGVVLWSIYDL